MSTNTRTTNRKRNAGATDPRRREGRPRPIDPERDWVANERKGTLERYENLVLKLLISKV